MCECWYWWVCFNRDSSVTAPCSYSRQPQHSRALCSCHGNPEKRLISQASRCLADFTVTTVCSLSPVFATMWCLEIGLRVCVWQIENLCLIDHRLSEKTWIIIIFLIPYPSYVLSYFVLSLFFPISSASSIIILPPSFVFLSFCLLALNFFTSQISFSHAHSFNLMDWNNLGIMLKFYLDVFFWY